MERDVNREEFLALFPDRNQQIMGLVYDHANPTKEGDYDYQTDEYKRIPRPFSEVTERFKENRSWGGEFTGNAWLTPKGLALTIGYTHHSRFLRMIGVEYSDAEKGGWIHISGSEADIERRVTAAQKRFLEALSGITVRRGALDDRTLPLATKFDSPFDVRPARIPVPA